ncbi:MAG: LuxR C-terminal-related transcriptional regulator [Duncaniella sp.]|nr:LuxR C-terminal-related transcriptional regulator [Duncaniella sp.]
MKVHNIAIHVKSAVADCGLRQILRGAEGLRVLSSVDSVARSARLSEASVVIADVFSLGACPEGAKVIGVGSGPIPGDEAARFADTVSLYDSADEILRKVRAAAGESRPDREDKRAGDLSPREKEVIRQIVKGLSNKEIASMMDVSVNTVMTHRRNIVAKLKIHSPAGLTIFALATGLVRMEDLSPENAV